MFKKGESGNPAGRPKGSISASTEKIKLAYTQLIEGNLESIQGWLNQTAAEDPARALDFLIKLSPFVVPKKSEQDITIDNPIQIVVPQKPEDK